MVDRKREQQEAGAYRKARQPKLSFIDPSDILYSSLIGFTVGMLDGGAGEAGW